MQAPCTETCSIWGVRISTDCLLSGVSYIAIAHGLIAPQLHCLDEHCTTDLAVHLTGYICDVCNCAQLGLHAGGWELYILLRNSWP